MWPKKPNEKAEDFAYADDPEFSTIRRKLARWAADNVRIIKDLKPPQPPGFNNRLSANWKLLLQFAPAEFVNDLKGRFYNCVAKSLAIQFYFRSAMTDVLSHVRDGVNEARRLFADQKLRVDRSMAAGEDAPLVRFTAKRQ